MKRVLLFIKELILYIFYPNKCVFCDKIIGLKGRICDNCKNTLPYTLESICPKCGKDDCVCLEEKYSFDEVIVPFYYDNCVSVSLQRFKFDNAFFYSKTYAYYIAEKLIKSRLAKDADIITYVPMTFRAQSVRGYNQARCIADDLSKITGIKAKGLLKKKKRTKNQHDLGGKQRRENLKNAFEVIDTVEVKGKTIILCDDIMTTGSTLNEVAKTLKKSGADKIICCVVASTYCRNGIFMAK